MSGDDSDIEVLDEVNIIFYFNRLLVSASVADPEPDP
jgi:hypothetical protein